MDRVAWWVTDHRVTKSWSQLKQLHTHTHMKYHQVLQRANSLEKTLMLGKIEGRKRGQQRTRWLMASLTKWT